MGCHAVYVCQSCRDWDKAFSMEKRLNNLQKPTWESYVKLGHAQDSRFTCRTPLVAIQRHLHHYKLTVLPLLLILQHHSWFSNLTEGIKYCLVECSFFPGTHHHFMWCSNYIRSCNTYTVGSKFPRKALEQSMHKQYVPSAPSNFSSTWEWG